MKKGLGISLFLAFTSCLSTTHDDVSSFHEHLKSRMSTQWKGAAEEDKLAESTIEAFLATDLELTSAIDIALLNNKALTNVYEELGLAQRNLITAGLLQTPSFSLEQFLDLCTRNMRGRLSRAEWEQKKIKLTNAALDLATDVEAAYYSYQAANAQVELHSSLLEASESAYELAKKQREAGSLNTHFLEDKKAQVEQIKAEIKQVALELTSLRRRLNGLMGLSEDKTWRITYWLEEIAPFECSSEELEQTVLQHRFDIAAVRKEIALIDLLKGDAQAIETASDIPLTAGSIAELVAPIFTYNVENPGGLAAHARRSKQRLKILEDKLVHQLREAQARLSAARSLTQQHAGLLLPLRLKILVASKKQNKLLTRSIYETFQDKREEVQARIRYEKALRDYWIARAELGRVIGSKLQTDSKAEE